MNAYAAFAQCFPADREQIFLEDETGRRHTYADLERESAAYSALLADCGLQPGDRVLAQVEKSPQVLWLYLACLRSGYCFVPLNPAYQRGELGYFLQDAAPRVAVCATDSLVLFQELGAAAGTPRLFTLDADGRGTLPSGAARCAGDATVAPLPAGTLATLIYTSGTTGRSKGAMVTHENLVANGRALAQTWGFSAADRLVHCLPVFHVHGLFVALHTVLLSGAGLLFQRRFDPAAVLAALPHATVFMGVPTYYTRLLESPLLDRTRCASIRLFVSGSAPLRPETFTAFAERTGQVILERYGMSEAGMIASNPLQGERRAGTVGRPLPGVDVRLAAEAGGQAAPGQPGVIEVRGANVFAGYWRMPEKTREEFTTDGWFRTGDVGQFDEAGYLSIVGRARDLIISGGLNVYPKEVELTIDQLPGVLESAVVGLPHADLGEAVTAAVVPRPGSALRPEDVIAHVKGQLAGFKVPKRVHLLDALPRNAMGKVEKNRLRELLSQ